jgi:NTE family protein
MTQDVTLVLGGGGSRGLAHIGVLKALEEARVPITRIIGTSAGSMIGALYAYHQNVHTIEKIVISSTKKDLLKKSLNFFKGLSEGEGVRDFIAKNIQDVNFDQLKLPFVAVAVDLNSGELVPLTAGSVAKAVQCSCALPPIFHPVKHKGRLLVDGGAIQPVPVGVAKSYQPDKIIAVNVGIELPEKSPATALGVMWRYGLIRIHELDRLTGLEADVVIRPHIPGADILDDRDKPGLIMAGYHAANQKMAEITQLLGLKPIS